MAATQHNASLYVGDLPTEITEAMLFELFKTVGPVLSIRVCRDSTSRLSLGYAYVNFQNPVDAERALETLNYHSVKGKPIRIMWSHRDPNLRKSGNGNVFIKNLHKDIDNQTLYDTFSQFGNILSCKVATFPNGKSRSYGFVHFESEESAKAAVEKVNGMLLKSMQVFVGRFERRSQRLQINHQNFTNVYVKNIKPMSEEEVQKYFEKFGKIKRYEKDGKEVISLCVRESTIHDKTLHYCFVDFEQHDSALQCIEALHDKVVPEISREEEKVFCQRAQKKTERLEELKKQYFQRRSHFINEFSASNLYIKNLDDSMTDEQLKSAFERFGEIKSAKVMMDKNVSRGFGFVCFKDPESANKAINEMNGLTIGQKPLYVSVAQRKEVRRATLEIQYAARISQMPRQNIQQPGMGYQQSFMGQPSYGPPHQFFPPQGYPYMNQGGRGMMQPQKWSQGGMAGGMNPFPPVPGQMGGRPPVRRVGGPMGGRGGAGPQLAGRGQYPIRGVPRGVPAPQANVGFNKQARNIEVGGAAPRDTPLPAVKGSNFSNLTLQQLHQMSTEEQKNALGERLFARISETHPFYAAKITGMLLEMEVSETLNLLESPEILQSKIEEAISVLKEHPESM